MTAIPLAEKYRPTSFDDLLGQEIAIAKVKALAARGSLSGRAYLVTGASGTGKTSLARIIAEHVADPFATVQWRSPRYLTADVVRRYFAPLGPSRVERFESANVWGLNFMLYDVLAGGASRSLRIDTQGKTLALTLLRMPIDRPANLEAMRREAKEYPT